MTFNLIRFTIIYKDRQRGGNKVFVKEHEFNKIKNILEGFKEVSESPYSESFYDRKVKCGEKPEGTIRVSDHWNYLGRDDELHAVTDIDITKNWAIGIYKEGIYEIVWQFDQDYHKKRNHQAQNEITRSNEWVNLGVFDTIKVVSGEIKMGKLEMPVLENEFEYHSFIIRK